MTMISRLVLLVSGCAVLAASLAGCPSRNSAGPC